MVFFRSQDQKEACNHDDNRTGSAGLLGTNTVIVTSEETDVRIPRRFFRQLGTGDPARFSPLTDSVLGNIFTRRYFSHVAANG